MSIDQHMTYYMKNVAENPDFDYDTVKNVFFKTVSVLEPLGNNIFHSSKGDFATSLFDIIMIGIAEHIDNYAEIPAKLISDKINQKVKSNDEIKKLSGRGANSRDRVIFRLKKANELFRGCIPKE
ncbi:MAG: hypothetical protein GY749_19050 [Desulfobacteraceae bacterium]|nr:hypothetical protein [Desulfobacteraceae bacterium]